MKIISQIMKKIWHILLVFIILLTILMATLKYGISIDKIDFGDFKAEQLYIKLDKKLILRARNIEIPKVSSTDSSNDSLLKITQNVGWIDLLFGEILLERIKFDNNEFTVLFFENAFHIDTPYLSIDTTFSAVENGLLVDVYSLAVKDFNINLSGQANADIKNNIYDFKGTFVSHELNGKAKLELKDEILRYQMSDINASSLKSFMDELGAKFELNKDLKSWIYGYVVADNYFVDNISGKVDLKKENFFLKDIKASGVSKNVRVKFSPSVEPAVVERVDVVLENETLKFKPTNPKWRDKNLSGTDVEIYEIFDEKGVGLLLNLKAKGIFDGKTNQILKDFGIEIPIEQKKGYAFGNLKLDINFDRLDVKVEGKFETKNSVFDIAGAKFNVSKADVEITNDRVLVNAKDSGMDFFNADANVNVDINTQTADITGFIKKFDLSVEGNEILKFQSLPLEAKLDFSKPEVSLKTKNPQVEFVFDKTNQIYANNLKQNLHLSPLLEKIGVKDGNLTLLTKDFENINVSLEDGVFDLPLADKNGLKHTKDSFYVNISKDKITADNQKENIKIKIKNGKIVADLKDIDFILESSSSEEAMPHIEFNAQNSNIILKDINRTLEFLTYNGSVDKNELKLEAKPVSGTLNIIKNSQKFDMFANDIGGEFVNSLIGKKSFEKGKFKLRILGDSIDDFKGEVRMHGANLKDYTFYNRLLTFLNSVPSLLVFKTPDFSEDGFPIKFGKILFQKKQDVLEFVAIDLESSSADIVGKGTINLSSKIIDIDLELRLLKDASSIIGSIPIVNQIILGKDRSISTVIKIRGTLDEPTYSTQILADTLMTPFNIIKNILEIPFVIFE